MIILLLFPISVSSQSQSPAPPVCVEILSVMTSQPCLAAELAGPLCSVPTGPTALCLVAGRWVGVRLAVDIKKTSNYASQQREVTVRMNVNNVL